MDGLKGKGFTVEKFKGTNDSIFAKFSHLGISVRFEALFESVKNSITKTFELSDGTSILVNALRPEEIVKRKVSAYIERKKIRDLYDVFFILKFVENRGKVKDALMTLVKEFEKPVDERELKALIISGSVPSVEGMLEAIRRWVE